MADGLFEGQDVGAGAAVPARKRGRPKGSTGKRSTDLVRYIEAHYGGLTPGQQLAAVGMVSAREVTAVRKKARQARLDPVVVAMGVKAKALAELLVIDLTTAWGMMRDAQSELMPYVHQKRPLGVEHTNPDGKLQPMIVGMFAGPAEAPMGAEVLAYEGEQFQGLIEGEAFEVSQPMSHEQVKGE
jgi:hypothetical protein